MKKLLILLLIMCFALPVFAEITHEKQKKDEIMLRGIINSDAGRLSKHQTAFKEDYDMYKTNDKNSIYFQILSLEKKYYNKQDEVSRLDMAYLNKVKDLYIFLADYPSEKAMSSKFVQEFKDKKIIISDYDYDKLDEDLVMLISLVNVYK